MNAEARLGAAEAKWLAETTPEECHFELFEDPVVLRRMSFLDALGDLRFGGYFDLKSVWIDDPRVVWISMIAGLSPGHGRALLGKMVQLSMRHNLAIMATPSPLKLRNWPGAREYPRKQSDLVAWYLRQGFRVIQDAIGETRVFQVPSICDIDVTFTLNVTD